MTSAAYHPLSFHSFLDAYVRLSEMLLQSPEVSPRGLPTREINELHFRIDDPSTIFELPENRLLYLAGEILWYAAGDFSLDWITMYSSFWKRIASPAGLINSNYGHRIFRLLKPTSASFFKALQQLKNDANTRQGLCHISTPEDVFPENLDIPCTNYLRFFIRENKLHLCADMRSNDIWKGLTFDIPAFYVFQQTMLHFLKPQYPTLELGSYYHHAGSFHVYAPNYTDLKSFIAQPPARRDFQLPTSFITSTGQPTESITELYQSCVEDPKNALLILDGFSAS